MKNESDGIYLSNDCDLRFENFFKEYRKIKSESARLNFCLEFILHKLKSHSMSAMVGAGFSQNADVNKSPNEAKHPDWAQLLLHAYISLNPGESENDEEKLLKEIKLTGESEIAAKYGKLNGSRESLDLYIENEFSKINKRTDYKELHKKLLSLPWEDVITTNWDTLLEDAANGDSSNRFYEVVKTAKQLRFQKPRIIKINGTLRTREEIKNRIYTFDDCSDYLYVITPQDFNEYAKEHEVFSNFMKGKFLECSFCLFGFSGNDPNFKYWIKELRRTMQKGEKTEEPNPIFLIDISKSDEEILDKVDDKEKRELKRNELKNANHAKELFYKNNYIIPIKLRSIINFISEAPNANVIDETVSAKKTLPVSVEKRTDEQFNEFFDYLEKRVNADKKAKYTNIKCGNNNEVIMNLALSEKQVLTDAEQNEYCKTSKFVISNLDFSGLFVDKIQAMGKSLAQWNSTTYNFVYCWCLNNFYSLSNLFKPETICKIIEKYDVLLQENRNDRRLYGFAELVLKYIREEDSVQNFYSACEKYRKIPPLENIVSYEQARLYAEALECSKLNVLLEEWTPEKDKNPSAALFIMRKISLFVQFENITMVQNKHDIIATLFEAAITCVQDRQDYFQYLYFIYCSYCYYLGNTGTIPISQGLNNKITELKSLGAEGAYKYIANFLKVEKVKRLEPNGDARYKITIISSEDFDGGNKKFIQHIRFLNFFEYTGLFAIGNVTEEDLVNSIAILPPSEKYIRKLLSISIQFYGTSREEEFLRVFIPRIFAKYENPELLKGFYEPFVSFFEYSLQNRKNTRVPLYLISELLKRLDDEYKQNWIDYFYKIVKSGIDKNDESDIAVNEIATGHVWGWGRPFIQFLKMIQGSEKIKTLLPWIMQNYVTAEKEPTKSSHYLLYEFLNYYFTIINEKKNGNIIKKIFENKDIQNLLKEDLMYSKKLALYAYNYVDSEIKKQVRTYYEANYTIQTDPYFITLFKSEKIKNTVVKLVCDFNMTRSNAGDFPLLTFVRAMKQANLLTLSDKNKIAESVFAKFKKIENLESLSAYDGRWKSNLIKTFFFIAAELVDGTREEDSRILFDICNVLKVAYKKSSSDLFDFEWLYDEDLASFRTNFIVFLSAIHYLKEEQKYLPEINMALSKIVLQDSAEFEGVLEQFLQMYALGYGNQVFENKNTIAILEQIESKFKKNIPLCYDDLFIKEQLKKMEVLLKRFGEK